MSWLSRNLHRVADALGGGHDCVGYPWCDVCLPVPVPEPPLQVRMTTADVLRRHAPDPLTRRCTCGEPSTPYYTHVVDELTRAGVLRDDETGGES